MGRELSSAEISALRLSQLHEGLFRVRLCLPSAALPLKKKNSCEFSRFLLNRIQVMLIIRKCTYYLLHKTTHFLFYVCWCCSWMYNVVTYSASFKSVSNRIISSYNVLSLHWVASFLQQKLTNVLVNFKL